MIYYNYHNLLQLRRIYFEYFFPTWTIVPLKMIRKVVRWRTPLTRLLNVSTDVASCCKSIFSPGNKVGCVRSWSVWAGASRGLKKMFKSCQTNLQGMACKLCWKYFSYENQVANNFALDNTLQSRTDVNSA